MHLFALVRGTRPRVHRVPLNQALQRQVHDLFEAQGHELLSSGDEIEFDPAYKPEQDELSYIDDFDDPEQLAGAPPNALGIPLLARNELTYQAIEGLFVVVDIGGTASVCLQSFDRRQILTRKRLTLLDIGDGFSKLEKAGLILETKLAAVLQGTKLYFRSYWEAGRVFDLRSYFREATDFEVRRFATHARISVSDVVSFNKVTAGSRLRKQIALIIASDVLDTHGPKQISERAAQFGLKIGTAKKGRTTALQLPSDRKGLKQVLDFLQENYYKGCLTSKTFVTNSKRLIA